MNLFFVFPWKVIDKTSDRCKERSATRRERRESNP